MKRCRRAPRRGQGRALAAVRRRNRWAVVWSSSATAWWERQVLGPGSPGAAPAHIVVQLRRYRCRACNAILIVGPRGLVPRRWYGAGAIALALVMYAGGATSAATRARVSPVHVVGASAVERWATLVRWDRSGAPHRTVRRGGARIARAARHCGARHPCARGTRGPPVRRRTDRARVRRSLDRGMKGRVDRRERRAAP